jgi:hypothetical protein
LINNSLVNISKSTPPTTAYGLFAQIADSVPVQATTNELSLIGSGLGTLSVPANRFKVGDAFLVIMTGEIGAQNNNTLTIRIKTDSIVLSTSGAIPMVNATNRNFKLEVFFTVRALGVSGVASIASGGSFFYTGNASTQMQGSNYSSVLTSGFDTTISNTLDITAQWSTNNAANQIYSHIFTLTKTF